ncbi:unnamed protein product [Pleuronectes platessa]|uniref:Uncharacterized protein n=1 Tax=Pleuronectes platessa TaxID=8262 RepID=A0A9N7YJV9_PLEPL|nr:unnamed protein product [Pleuronectes platessa]
MPGRENGALAGKGTGKQKSGERRKEKERERGGGPKITQGSGERGEIKGTVKRKNSASSSYSGRRPLGTPLTSTHREVRLWRPARADKTQNASLLHAPRRLIDSSVFTLRLTPRCFVTLSIVC